MSTPIGSSQWMYSSGVEFSIDQSLRFNDADDHYLNRVASTGDSQKWTWSGWVKRGNLGTLQAIFSEGTSASSFALYFNTTDTLYAQERNSSSNRFLHATDAVFRDVAAWYHIVYAVDTTQATDSDRVNLYVNGQIQTLAAVSGSIYPSLDLSTNMNVSGRNHSTGYAATNSFKCLDGYLAEVNFVDSEQLDATDFGETINGIWVPKAYSGSYGVNGYYLTFSSDSFTDNASDPDVFADQAGSNNHNAYNFKASDIVLDSPTNNFSTINILDSHAASTYTEGSLNFADGGGDGATCLSTFVVPDIADTTTYYIELLHHQGYALGIAPQEYSAAHNELSRTGVLTWYSNGNLYTAGAVSTSSWSTASTTGEIRSMVVGNGQVEYFRNGVSLGVAFTGLTGAYKIAEWAAGSAGTGVTFNFGQDDTFANAVTSGSSETADANGHGKFYYSEAASHISLCAANLPEPTIGPNSAKQADDYFNTVLYTGDGTSSNAITVGLQPDFLWIKQRSLVVRGHQLMDSVRGASVRFQSHGAEAESASALVSFDSDGFTVDGTTLNGTNANGDTFVAWNWKAGGAAVLNEDGTIDSQVSAAPDAGFSIVTWVGNNTDGATVGHGLTDPEFSIVKNRDSGTNWDVCWSGFTSGTSLNLDTTAAEFSPTTGYQQLGTSTITLKNGGSGIGRVNGTPDDYMAYVFKSVEGYSKVASYVGNGQNSPNGNFIHTGFRPAFVMVKDITDTGSWIIIDNKRAESYNIDTARLYANDSAAETALNTNRYMELFSNGFRVHGENATSTANKWNENGDSYIYLAFAEQPFKYANAR